MITGAIVELLIEDVDELVDMMSLSILEGALIGRLAGWQRALESR